CALLSRFVDVPWDSFATKPTLGELTRRFGYAFRPWQPPGFFRPVMVPREVIAGETVCIARMEVNLIDQDHGFSHSLGLRINAFGYSTDVMNLDETALDALRDLDI